MDKIQIGVECKMIPKIEICKSKCPHFCTQEKKCDENHTIFTFHIYADWPGETDGGWHKDGLHCKIAKHNMGYEEDGKFVPDDEFKFPSACPFVLEHTVL